MNHLIRLNKIKYPVIAYRHKVKTKAYNDKKRKKAAKRELKLLRREQQRLMDRLTMEPRLMRRMFPNAEIERLVIKMPKDMKGRFEAWCSYRDYSPAGRLRKFIYDCVTGVIQE